MLYMAGIYALSAVSRPPDLPSIVGDKVAHAVLYFGLGALFARALAGGWRRPLTLRAAAVAAIGSTLLRSPSPRMPHAYRAKPSRRRFVLSRSEMPSRYA